MEEESEAEKKFVKSQAKYITDGEVPLPYPFFPLPIHYTIVALPVYDLHHCCVWLKSVK